MRTPAATWTSRSPWDIRTGAAPFFDVLQGLFFFAVTQDGSIPNPFDEAGSDADTSNSSQLVDLMVRYQAGDADAVRELIGALSPRLARYFGARLDARRNADDLAQDFWLRLHRNRHTYRPGEPFLPWFYSIARNARVDGYRRRSRVERREFATDVLPDVAVAPVVDEGDRGFHELLAHLPESQREALVLMKVEGLTLEEVARATASTAGAVKQKVHRAYEKLRKVLMERDTKGTGPAGKTK